MFTTNKILAFIYITLATITVPTSLLLFIALVFGRELKNEGLVIFIFTFVCVLSGLFIYQARRELKRTSLKRAATSQLSNNDPKQEGVKPHYNEYNPARPKADNGSETQRQITKKPPQFIFVITLMAFFVTMSLYFTTRFEKILVIGILLTVALAIFGRFKSKTK